MNIGKIILGGIVAGIIYFAGDGVVHGALLKPHWTQVLGAIGVNPQQALESPAYFAPYDLLKGLLVVWLYASIRPRFGPGPKTAALAGLAVWFATIPVPMLGLLPMKFFGANFVVLWALYAIIPMVLGALVGGWIYREKP
jgi:hypothetical protein